MIMSHECVSITLVRRRDRRLGLPDVEVVELRRREDVVVAQRQVDAGWRVLRWRGTRRVDPLLLLAPGNLHSKVRQRGLKQKRARDITPKEQFHETELSFN